MNLKASDLTLTQRHALAEAAHYAYLRGWNGRLRAKEEPNVRPWATEGTLRALKRRGAIDGVKAGGLRQMPLTKAGLKAAEEALSELYPDEHPRDTFQRQEQERRAIAEKAKAQRDKVAGLLEGVTLIRPGRFRGTEKLKLSKEIREGIFPQLDLDDLEVICDHLTRRK